MRTGQLPLVWRHAARAQPAAKAHGQGSHVVAHPLPARGRVGPVQETCTEFAHAETGNVRAHARGISVGAHTWRGTRATPATSSRILPPPVDDAKCHRYWILKLLLTNYCILKINMRPKTAGKTRSRLAVGFP